MAGCKEQNSVPEGLRKATPSAAAFGAAGIGQLHIRNGAGRKTSHSLSGSTFPAPRGEGTLCEKPTPDDGQEHTAMGKRFNLCPDEVMDPGETA